MTMMNVDESLKNLIENAIDVTLTIKENMVTYPGDPKPLLQRNKVTFAKNMNFTTTTLTLTSHTGTHVDYPSHFYSELTSSSDLLPQSLIGKAMIIDVNVLDRYITKDDLTYKWKGNWDNLIVILKTGKGKDLEKGMLATNYPVLTEEAAKFLVNHHIKAIGIDALSIDPIDSTDLTLHQLFLKAEIPLIEGLNLEHVKQGPCWILCFPLKVEQLDGSPARVLIIPLEENKKIKRE